MTDIAESALDLIGGTPLVALRRLAAEAGAKATVAAKVEYFNPAGSVKDRVALAMVEQAEKDGTLAPGPPRLPSAAPFPKPKCQFFGKKSDILIFAARFAPFAKRPKMYYLCTTR